MQFSLINFENCVSLFWRVRDRRRDRREGNRKKGRRKKTNRKGVQRQIIRISHMHTYIQRQNQQVNCRHI